MRLHNLVFAGSFVVELELACYLACLIVVDRDLDLFGTCLLGLWTFDQPGDRS